MKTDEFEITVNEQLEKCTITLIEKAKEYADPEDRLHNFDVAAKMLHCTPRQVVVSFMAKHTVSVFDMATGDKQYPIELWEEKIGDHINYLLLLKAAVVEEINNHELRKA